jgi:hypothetical protein
MHIATLHIVIQGKIHVKSNNVPSQLPEAPGVVLDLDDDEHPGFVNKDS